MRFIYLALIVPASVVVPICIGAWRYRWLNRALKLVLSYVVVSGIVNAVASLLAARRINNMPLLHIYTAIEFVLLALFYKQMFTGFITRAISWLCVLFPLACVLNAIFFESIYTYNSIMRSLESFIIGSLSILFFFRQLDSRTTERPAEAVLWINAGIMLYFSGSFMLFLFSEVLLHGNKQVENLAWVLHATFVLIMYLLFATGFLRTNRS